MTAGVETTAQVCTRDTDQWDRPEVKRGRRMHGDIGRKELRDDPAECARSQTKPLCSEKCATMSASPLACISFESIVEFAFGSP